ncbi:IS630 family transposase [Anabaenopsis sp. FSS-46]|uniref:IS630 family transposase n=1 Tax=Anabaenopsis sp. FSS-46 TaxID=2971766 RepID=UPI0024749731|nr:IS630 family transposase [Anabaenopsis sp. FSS-46]MDH6100780.1 IS630 family transposase [Anabaenopsis sp. FSS-46]
MGLKTEPRRVLTNPGVQPVVRVSWKRESFWLYGVVEPLSGWHFCLEYPKLCGEHFQQFLDALSSQLAEDIALLQIDQAAAHLTSQLKWPENIIPLCQPAHCPQLNPIERFWLFLKSQIKGQVFNTLDELRARLNELLSQITSERVISLTSYDFILEALFYAASM